MMRVLYIAVEIHAATVFNVPIIFRIMRAEVQGSTVSAIMEDSAQMLESFIAFIDVSKAQCAVEADRIRELGVIGEGGLLILKDSLMKAMATSLAAARFSCSLYDSYECGEPEALLSASGYQLANEVAPAAIAGDLTAVCIVLASCNGVVDLSSSLRGVIETGRAAVFSFLMSIGADFDKVDEINQRTSAGYAAEHDRLEFMKILAQRGACLDTKDRYGMSPLHWAANNDCLNTLKFLCTTSCEKTTRCDKVRSESVIC